MKYHFPYVMCLIFHYYHMTKMPNQRHWGLSISIGRASCDMINLSNYGFSNTLHWLAGPHHINKNWLFSHDPIVLFSLHFSTNALCISFEYFRFLWILREAPLLEKCSFFNIVQKAFDPPPLLFEHLSYFAGGIF